LRTLEGHTQALTAALYSPDGRWLGTSSHDQSVRMWQATSGACVAVADGLPAAVRGIALTRDGTRLAAALADGTARIWNVGNDESAPKLTPAARNVLDGRSGKPADEDVAGYCVAWNKSGTHLALGIGGWANLS